MQKISLTTWKWPGHVDIHNYPISDIIQIIKHPVSFNRRGQCIVPEIKKYW